MIVILYFSRSFLVGDTVNFASRMQSNCPPNQIQMSEPTAMMLMSVTRYELKKRGIVRVKGKGDVNTYWLNELVEDASLKKEELSAPISDESINKNKKKKSTKIPPNLTNSTDETVSETGSFENHDINIQVN